MTTAMSDNSTRRVLWWARTFGRPLHNEFTPPVTDEMPEEFSELLEMADKRLGESHSKNEN